MQTNISKLYTTLMAKHIQTFIKGRDTTWGRTGKWAKRLGGWWGWVGGLVQNDSGRKGKGGK